MPSVATIVLEGRDRVSQDIDRVARSLDRLDDVKTIRLDGSGISGVATGMRGAEQAAAKLTNTAGSLGGSLRTVSSTAAGLAGVFGVAFGAQALVGFGSEALQTANSLEVTQARVLALAGSTERYNEIVRLAKSGQQAYGGTLEENIAALGGFVNMSNRTGVAIDTLDNAARRLAAADPVQGIEGASVALREFLTGTGAEAVTSLAERFELPKKALTALAQEGVSTQQRMAGLDALLNQMGYTNEFLAAQTDTTANTFIQLSGAWSDFKSAVGSGIAVLIEPAAAQVVEDLRKLTEGFTDAAVRQADVLSQTGTYAEYAAAVGTINSKYADGAMVLDRQILGLEQLTPAQYAATQALMAQGVAADEAARRAQALADIESTLALVHTQQGAALTAMLPQLLSVAAASETNEARVRDLMDAYIQSAAVVGGEAEANRVLQEGLAALSMEQALAAQRAGELALARQTATQATQASTTATQSATEAAQAETAAAALETAQSKLNAQAKDELAGRAEAAAAALYRSGDASTAAMQAMATQYGVTLELVGAYYQLAQAANVAAAAQAQRAALEDYRAGERNLGMTGGGIGSAAKEQQAHALAAQQLEERKAAAKAAEAAAKKGASAAKKGASSAASAAKKEAAAEASAAKKAASAEAKAQADAAREAEALQKAQDALLSDEERLAVFRQRLAAGGLPEVERLELMKQIADLEETVTNEQEKQRRAALDAALAAIDDRKQRREEAKELEAARRVLASSGTSEAQKAAARDVLERIPLEQEKRAQAIADKLQDAGQAAVAGGAAGAPPVPVSVQPVATAPISIAQAGLPIAAATLPALTINQTLVLPDGTVIGTGSLTTNLNNPVADLRLALRATGV